MREIMEDSSVNEEIYRNAEEKANRFNLVCLGLLSVLVLLSEVLNELGIFTAPIPVMRGSTVLGILFFNLAALAVLACRLTKKNEDLLRRPGFKYLIILSGYLGIGVFSVAITVHTVLLAAIPALLVAQYRYQKKLLILSLAGSVLLILAGVYGGFFLGMPDRNFLKGMLTDEEAMDLANRVPLATPRRMAELFAHYAVPRLLGVFAVSVLASGIARRNDEMLHQQSALTERVQEEMKRRSGMQNHVIEDLAALIETRDQSTGEHVIRTKKYVAMIAEAMRRQGMYPEELTAENIAEMRDAAPLHDVGKISVSDTILLKPGKLTREEFEEMKSHAPKGGKVIRDIFRNLDDPVFLKTAEEIATSHHEKWDGKGYPGGLKGEEIPLSARIMAAADVYDALVSPRIYKEPVTPEEALAILEGGSGAHFDPKVIKAIGRIREQLIAEAKKPIEREEF